MPVFLDVDSSLLEKNLKITDDPDEEEFKRLFSSEEKYPSKLVKPFPGFCIKSKEVGSDTKIFVNICHTDAIPPPKDISEEELVEICDSDVVPEFRIPMSIGELREETDKKGCNAKAVDIAIHPKFFHKVENSSLFKNFFMAVVFEGIRNKHKLHTTDDRILLKNRKAYGELQMHRIQQREIEQKMGEGLGKEKSLVEELTGNPEGNKPKPRIEILSSTTTEENQNKTPEYRLFKKIAQPNILMGEFKLANVINSNEISLEVGEDRIILESKNKGYFLDVFVPCNIIQEDVVSDFNNTTKILTVTMPIKSA